MLEPGEAFDVVVVGGGVNGAGITRDAAGRGLKVLMVEQHDLASHTSSSSTKLIHGGLRYLEHYDFGLVRKALLEREVLLRSAPHIISPLRFVMPHDRGQRPAWMIRIGLMLYDHLARRELLPGSEAVTLAGSPLGAALKDEYRRGFAYSDCWVDDARLVVLCAVDAAERGATVLTRTRCVAAQRDRLLWRIELAGQDGPETVTARVLINAAGPWAGSFVGSVPGAGQRALRLIKGSHIVVPRLFEHDHAYIFQNPDSRIVFAIPYEQRFTLVGTTDVDYPGDPGDVAIDASEIQYLCSAINRYFRQPIAPKDVVWSYSGVRPLLEDEAEDASSVTRDYALELDGGPTDNEAPMLNVFGGKITTFRRLAEEAVDSLIGLFEDRPQVAQRWTEAARLPGGDIAGDGARAVSLDEFVTILRRDYPFVPAALLRRLASAYGTRARRIIGPSRQLSDLGREVLPGLFDAELRYLVDHEWARTADDVLWRRSKLGLHFQGDAASSVQEWLEQNLRPVSRWATHA